MIPVLVTSTMNRPDLLDRLLDSIDVEVGRLLVVDNGRTGYQREGATVFQPPFQSLGWPGTLNFGIMQTPDAPWWLLVNDDAWFEPGLLHLLTQTVEDDLHNERTVVHHHEWTVVALTPLVIERVGLFDEWSFWPLYFDDTDYAYRCSLAGIPVIDGDWCREGDIGHEDARNEHGATVRSDPALAAANHRTWQINEVKYRGKWGGPPGREQYKTPWGLDLPLWATKPDPWGRAARAW